MPDRTLGIGRGSTSSSDISRTRSKSPRHIKGIHLSLVFVQRNVSDNVTENFGIEVLWVGTE